MKTKIEVLGISKKFGDHQVLRDVSLKVKEGENLVIIGSSGGGKTVLLKHIIGLLKPDSGKILIDGEEVTDKDGFGLKPLRKKFGMVFQSSALFNSLTVAENIGLGPREARIYTEKEIKEIVEEKLQLVGLEGIGDLMPEELSGGMKKRVALARSLAMNPEIILYDEPTSELDPPTAHTINQLILNLKEKLKVTSVTVTHDINCAYFIGDRIAMLHEGKIIKVATPEEIRASCDPIVGQFLTRDEWKKGCPGSPGLTERNDA
ncbi:MAG: ATP-binding cassette domain-containing protein [Nitrospirae bacterium]|nr:ATP-binding cassette domain-containing protein [Nitrospirota bacterium]